MKTENDIIPTELAIRAMRDSGYKNTAYALSELIDNSVQASANLVEVFCIEDTIQFEQRSGRRITSIAVLDNGSGMPHDILRLALQFGNGTYLNNRSGIGRFGMGLPNASISQGKCVEVWSWQSGPENALYSYLDIDEIESGSMRHVPEPIAKPVPTTWREIGKGFCTHGTLIVWSKLDFERLTWKRSKATLEHTETLVGRIYRKFINNGDLTIRLTALTKDTEIFCHDVKANDPLYLMNSTSTPVPFDSIPMFYKYGEEDQIYNICLGESTHSVTIRASVAKIETLPEDGIDRGSKPYGKHAAKNIGISIVRADRELELDSSWSSGYDPIDRWWGIEVDFPPELDEIFGVTNNKQTATLLSSMVNFDWTIEAEPGESYPDFKKRIAEEGDPRAILIHIVDYIRDTKSSLVKILRSQTAGRRSGGKRHEDTSVEDRATTKFNDRANVGKSIDSDSEIFDDKAKQELVKDLVSNKSYPESDAKEIAEAVQRRHRKVIFVEVDNDMDAFFGVEQKPGGITEIVFNRNHPAFNYLIKTLDHKTENATDLELIARIENASATLKMIFAAWARQEMEDVPNREKLRRMRQDWGRMAYDFLNDEVLG